MKKGDAGRNVMYLLLLSVMEKLEYQSLRKGRSRTSRQDRRLKLYATSAVIDNAFENDRSNVKQVRVYGNDLSSTLKFQQLLSGKLLFLFASVNIRVAILRDVDYMFLRSQAK